MLHLAISFSRPMPKAQSTEIDAIFAVKGKRKASPPAVLPGVASTESPSPAKKKKKKDRAKEISSTAVNGVSNPPSSASSSRPVPEVVVDPSLRIEAQLAKSTGSAPNSTNVVTTRLKKAAKSIDHRTDGSYLQMKKLEQEEKQKVDDRKFADSRGTGPREWRHTVLWYQ